MNFITSEMLCKFTNKVVDETDTQPASYCASAMETVRDYLGYDPESQTMKVASFYAGDVSETVISAKSKSVVIEPFSIIANARRT